MSDVDERRSVSRDHAPGRAPEAGGVSGGEHARAERPQLRTRRAFITRVGLTAGAGAIAPAIVARRLSASPGAAAGRGPAGPLIRDGAAPQPTAISSGNGLRATEVALEKIRAGADTLEAVVSGVNLVEADPEDYTVGYGGLPNAEGVVQLDSQVWHGPTRGAGAVAALEGYVHPSRVAMAVMRYTDHVVLVGEGAASFAAEMGFDSTELLTEYARRRWLRWRAAMAEEDDYLLPGQSGEPIRSYVDPGGVGALAAPPRDEIGAAPSGKHRNGKGALADGGRGHEPTLGELESHDGVRPWGTIHCSAVNEAGAISAVTTTSGLFFKVPGRVGDSPLPGCGCYCDNDVGAAGGTGRGEAVIKTVGGHLIVEEMRRGAHPRDACLTALRRIVDWTVEDRLLDERGRPNFNVSYYALNVRGETGAASLWSGSRHAVNGAGAENRLADSAYLFERE